jgi:hypothetical protein
LVGSASAMVCWPLAWDPLTRLWADVGAEFAALAVRPEAFGTAVHSVLNDQLHRLRVVLAETLGAQLALVLCYEWLAVLLTGVTLGKALMGVRVLIVDRDGGPVVWGRRALRVLARSTLAVLPGGILVSTLVVAATGSGPALVVATAAFAILFIDTAVGVPNGVCVHDRLGHSRVYRIMWREAGRAAGTAIHSTGAALGRRAVPTTPAASRRGRKG